MRRVLRAAGAALARVLRPVTRLLRPVSGVGWAVLVVAAVGVGLGGVLGWVELAVVGVGALSALVAAVLLSTGRSTYAVDLDLADHRVTVGQRAVGRLAVRNTSRRRLLPARIELPVGRGSADFALPSLGPGAEHEDVFAIPTTRRAVVVVGPVRSVRGDPLGLVRRRVQWTEPTRLYVHPTLVSLAGAAAGVLRDMEGQSTREVSNSDMSFHALRDYVPGDDRRHIHWKTTARIGELMVRQFEDTRRTHTVVALSTCLADYADEEEFELAVSAAASLGVQALRDERDLTVLAGDGALRADAPSRLLDDVAELEVTAGGRGLADLAAWIAQDAREASAAILVTGSVADRTALRAAVARVPAGMRTLVLGCRTGAPLEVNTRGGLSVAQVGSLPDLPRVLRRVVAA
ncbi:DUF58 domain-containing protein [Actinotalea sp.]|uniref:DUF58 domain-containing protein n=1 Tax=Actinotalea sp. TaxID=1872145 RepID=UPI002C6DD779|nr:DUF58 domain-containing protein [Actinotalea sp.]HQY32359.1 DUF58 domain-containing protein [Actinotalea sp.]HRA49740.1 DUF58 domain-containing protein [Actinotalea sp.]